MERTKRVVNQEEGVGETEGGRSPTGVSPTTPRPSTGSAPRTAVGTAADSLLSAILGAKRLPKKWIEPIGARAGTCIIGHRWWRHANIVQRFARIARA